MAVFFIWWQTLGSACPYGKPFCEQNRLTFADHFDPLEQMLERFLLYAQNSQK